MSLNNDTFSAVTTFNSKKQSFGIEMIESFFLNWPDNIKLTAYIEGSKSIDTTKVNHKIFIREFHESIPEYQKFCEKFRAKKPLSDDFRFNVFRFAHKVYAISTILKEIKTKYLIWLDSDIKTHKKIPISFLNTLVDDSCYLSYLGREDIYMNHLNYSECGFLIFNTEHFIHSKFWSDMMVMYDEGKLFEEKEWHDSYVFDVVRKNLERTAKIKNFNISKMGLVDVQDESHVFVASVLGNFMDHKKGNRKQYKWSRELLYRIKNERNN